MKTEYTFASLDDLAKYFDGLADRDADSSKGAKSARYRIERKITSQTWRSAADVIRNATITGE